MNKRQLIKSSVVAALLTQATVASAEASSTAAVTTSAPSTASVAQRARRLSCETSVTKPEGAAVPRLTSAGHSAKMANGGAQLVYHFEGRTGHKTLRIDAVDVYSDGSFNTTKLSLVDISVDAKPVTLASGEYGYDPFDNVDLSFNEIKNDSHKIGIFCWIDLTGR